MTKYLFQEKQQLLSEFENLHSRINMLEQDKSNITKMIVQKDAFVLKLQDEILMYK